MSFIIWHEEYKREIIEITEVFDEEININILIIIICLITP